MARQDRPLQAPPVLKDPSKITPTGRQTSVVEVGRAFDRSDASIQLWIRQGRLIADRIGTGHGMYLVRESEVRRAKRAMAPKRGLPKD